MAIVLGLTAILTVYFSGFSASASISLKFNSLGTPPTMTKRWADSNPQDSDSEQELLPPDWHMTNEPKIRLVEAKRNVSRSSQWDPKASDSSDTDIVMVDSGNTVQLRKPPPKEVKQQIIAKVGLTEKQEMLNFLQASTDAQTPGRPESKGLEYRCNWCKKPGVKSQRLLCHYNTSEWRSSCFRLCFRCAQGDFSDDEEESGYHPRKYYVNQPDDTSFVALSLVQDKPAGVWLDPDQVDTLAKQALPSEVNTEAKQAVLPPGLTKISLDSKLQVTKESPAAYDTKDCVRDQEPTLPRIDFDWSQMNGRETEFNSIRVQAFCCNLFEIIGSNGKTLCADRQSIDQCPQMRPPNWGWNSDRQKYKWGYTPMFRGANPLREFKKACNRAQSQWDACQALDFLEMRTQHFQRCAQSTAQELGVAPNKLDYKDKMVSLRDSEFAVSLCQVLPPVPRHVNEPTGAYRKRLIEHFDKVQKMGALFDRWEQDFACRIDPKLQREFCSQLYHVDHLTNYLDKITDTHHEFFLCRKCGHFGPSAQWIEHGGSYLCPRENCHWGWHGRKTTDCNSALLPATHVWAITVKHFKTPTFDLDHSQPQACLPGNDGVSATARSSTDVTGVSVSTRSPTATPPEHMAKMNPLLTGESMLTEASISLDKASVPAALKQSDYQFALIDWSQCMGHEGAVELNMDIKRELKGIWNDLSIEGANTDLQRLADQVWDQIKKVERHAYFQEHEVPDNYTDQVRNHLNVWQPNGKKRELSIEHWPRNKRQCKYFDSARVDVDQFPMGQGRLDKVMDYKKQLQHWGRARFWVNVSKDNFHEVKRWMAMGDLPEDMDQRAPPGQPY